MASHGEAVSDDSPAPGRVPAVAAPLHRAGEVAVAPAASRRAAQDAVPRAPSRRAAEVAEDSSARLGSSGRWSAAAEEAPSCPGRGGDDSRSCEAAEAS